MLAQKITKQTCGRTKMVHTNFKNRRNNNTNGGMNEPIKTLNMLEIYMNK